jgi:hypothetical protein
MVNNNSVRAQSRANMVSGKLKQPFNYKHSKLNNAYNLYNTPNFQPKTEDPLYATEDPLYAKVGVIRSEMDKQIVYELLGDIWTNNSLSIEKKIEQINEIKEKHKDNSIH